MQCPYCDKTIDSKSNCLDTNCPGSTWSLNPRTNYRINLVGFREELDNLGRALAKNQWKLKFLGHDGGWLGEPIYLITKVGFLTQSYQEPAIQDITKNKEADLAQIIGLQKELFIIKKSVQNQGWKVDRDQAVNHYSILSPWAQKE
jgi:hypothetical protein